MKNKLTFPKDEAEKPVSNLPVVRKKRVQKVQAVAVTSTTLRLEALESEAEIERTRAESYRTALRANTYNQGRA